MRYLSVCSGIEAATVAWHPLGWTPVAFSEIDAFPSAVLAHHYPDVPNFGDMTRFQEWPDAEVDVLVGGTPCQSYSVAGLRRGLDDPRGALMLVYLAIARRYRPTWVVWENVPGVLSSDGGRAFGSLLGGLAELGYGFAYRVLDAQYFGLAQRRARVFVVGCLGDWRRAAAVLLERESLSGHPAPRRETGQVAPTVPARRTGGGGLGTDFDCDGGVIAGYRMQAFGEYADDDTASSLKARDFKDATDLIAHALRASGFDASEDGTGRGTPLVPVPFDTTQITSAANYSHPKPGDPCHPLAAAAHPPAVAFDARQSDVLHYGNQSGPLDTDGHSIAVAYALGSHAGAADGDQTNRSHAAGGPVGLGVSEDVAYSLRGGRTQSVGTAMQVRRLTPRECERLQGFPDDYTRIPYRGKPAADGPRYKALGNSMAVPVMRWIGRRIALVEALTADMEATA